MSIAFSAGSMCSVCDTGCHERRNQPLINRKAQETAKPPANGRSMFLEICCSLLLFFVSESTRSKGNLQTRAEMTNFIFFSGAETKRSNGSILSSVLPGDKNQNLPTWPISLLRCSISSHTMHKPMLCQR